MSSPNRRVAADRGKNPKKSTRVADVRAETVMPSANAWAIVERKKGAPVHLDEVGELIVSAIPKGIRAEVLHAIANAAEVARTRDPNHVVMSFVSKDGGIRITTSENQMPVRIGKKLDASFKGGKLTISYSDRDLPVRVRWTPPETKK